jgi:hypothetical protein
MFERRIFIECIDLVPGHDETAEPARRIVDADLCWVAWVGQVDDPHTPLTRPSEIAELVYDVSIASLHEHICGFGNTVCSDLSGIGGI